MSPLTRILLLELTIAGLFLVVGALANLIEWVFPKPKNRGTSET